MNIVEPKHLLDQLEGATVVSGYVENEEGMHICFQDGRVLVIVGTFAAYIDRISRETLN
jgi:hypothetical protein